MDFPNKKVETLYFLGELWTEAQYGGFSETMEDAISNAEDFIIEGMTEKELKEWKEFCKRL